MFAAPVRALILLPLVASACASTRLVLLAPQKSSELRDYSAVVLKTSAGVVRTLGLLGAIALGAYALLGQALVAGGGITAY